MKFLLAILVLLSFGTAATAAEFEIGFTWDGLALCTTGQPDVVPSPEFSVSGAPDGTKWIYFKLVDLDVPTYPHGGGWAAYTGDTTVAAGAFTYNSPCPPNGAHTYEWRAAASASNDYSTPILGFATAQRQYPE